MRVVKNVTTKEDGRKLIYYTFEDVTEADKSEKE
jgi:hypothetical protein